MSRIKYQTDEWGPDKADHMEVHYGGVIVFITITDDGIDVHGQCSIDVEEKAVNRVIIRPVITERTRKE